MTTTDLLAGIERAEGAAFRIGQLARTLLAEHQDLTHLVKEISGFAGQATAQLDLDVDGLNGARLWARRLGIELKSHLNPSGSGGWEHLDGEIDVQGVRLQVHGLQSYDAEAWATRLLEQQLAELRQHAEQHLAERGEGISPDHLADWHAFLDIDPHQAGRSYATATAGEPV